MDNHHMSNHDGFIMSNHHVSSRITTMQVIHLVTSVFAIHSNVEALTLKMN